MLLLLAPYEYVIATTCQASQLSILIANIRPLSRHSSIFLWRTARLHQKRKKVKFEALIL